MIIDLAKEDMDCADADVAVIGAGVAGLLLATRLANRGLQVVLLESGGERQTEDVHPFNRVVQNGEHYHGATHGRFRCLGGTSTRWGGALLPFAPVDFAARPKFGLPEWPVKYAEVLEHLPAIERLFDLRNGSFEEDYVRAEGLEREVPIADRDFTARFAKWPSFKRRNIYRLFESQIRRGERIRTFINATVTDFSLNVEQGRLASVTARSEAGRRVEVHAKHFAVCAGAIESTRLLLLLDAQHGGTLFSRSNVLGRYFHDHVSAAAAEIKAPDTVGLNRFAGFRFDGGTMRSLRYELSREAQEEEQVAGAFGHIGFESLRPSGFDTLRDILRSGQQRRRFRGRLALRLLADLPYFLQAARWRLSRRQLRWPEPATYRLHTVVEQLPHADNRITLAHERDSFGLPLAALDWRLRPADYLTFDAFKRRFEVFWRRNGLQSIGALEWQPDVQGHRTDIFHPGGSTRMGVSAASAVVDPNLQTFAVPNLSVASTSTFPSGASANPTLMLMLFTERLAGRLVTDLREPA